jgi:ketosteroid isomerase-like protein
MRKSVCSILILLLLASVQASARQDDAAVLRAMLDEFLAGAGRNDLKTHDRFWADDLIYTGSSGRRTSKSDILDSLRSAKEPGSDQPSAAYSAEDVKINIYGNAAVVAFKLVAVTEMPDGKSSTQNYFNTGTFIKRDDEWRAVAWQATAIPEK